MGTVDAVSSRDRAVDVQDPPTSSTPPRPPSSTEAPPEAGPERRAGTGGRDGAAPGAGLPPHEAIGANVEQVLRGFNSQLRWSFRIAAVMSALLFAFGVAFLAVAVFQALDGELEAAAVVAGIGLAAFVLLYFTHPRRNLARNLAGSEQVHIVTTSYLAGLAFAERHDSEALMLLNQLTAHSIVLLEDRAEGLSEQRLAALRAATLARATPPDQA
jgi:hypothetical protein